MVALARKDAVALTLAVSVLPMDFTTRAVINTELFTFLAIVLTTDDAALTLAVIGFPTLLMTDDAAFTLAVKNFMACFLAAKYSSHLNLKLQ